MPQERFPVAWLGEAAVITLPEEIDISNSEQVREELLLLLYRGPAVLVRGVGETRVCALPAGAPRGCNARVRAHKRATANGAEVRLVVASLGVGRVLAITGVDRLIPVCPSMTASLAEPGEPAETHRGPGDRA